MKRSLWLIVSGLLVVAACADEGTHSPSVEPSGSAVLGLETDPDEAAESEISSSNDDAPGAYQTLDEANPHTDVQLVSQGTATLLPVVEPMRRARQRLTIPQLSDSLTHVTGGIGWTEIQGGQEADLFEVFAASLGVPDYVEMTREDLSASALFHKFLDEAARFACHELVMRELSGEPVEAYLMVHANAEDTVQSAPEAIDANLRYLLLRYHGRKVVGDAPILTPWRWLFESVTHVAGDPAVGWRGVCVALISHPDFYSF